MKKLFGIFAGATMLICTFATLAVAQHVTSDSEVIIRQTRMQGPEGAPPPSGADFVFIASESFGGKVVKGAPYSAEALTESVQTLSDGNRIITKIASTLHRDSEGRTRREQPLKGLGFLGTSEEPLQMIFINDPVAGVTYSLDSRTRTAHKSGSFSFSFTGQPGGVPGSEGTKFDFKLAPGAPPPAGASVVVTAPLGGGPGGSRVPMAVGGYTGPTHPGAITFIARSTAAPNTNQVTEQLGKQIIEGVEVEGIRTTITIPAGEIGNERPIEMVNERWYSPELQLIVMSRHRDPRSGETTYKLTNINRSEPAKSLFEVPSDYTIKVNTHLGPNIAPIPRATRKPANPE